MKRALYIAFTSTYFLIGVLSSAVAQPTNDRPIGLPCEVKKLERSLKYKLEDSHSEKGDIDLSQGQRQVLFRERSNEFGGGLYVHEGAIRTFWDKATGGTELVVNCRSKRVVHIQQRWGGDRKGFLPALVETYGSVVQKLEDMTEKETIYLFKDEGDRVVIARESHSDDLLTRYQLIDFYSRDFLEEIYEARLKKLSRMQSETKSLNQKEKKKLLR